MNKSSISDVRNQKAKMAMLPTSQSGRNRTSISFELRCESLKRFVGGLAMNPCEHFVLEIRVLEGH